MYDSFECFPIKSLVRDAMSPAFGELWSLTDSVEVIVHKFFIISENRTTISYL